MMILVNFRIKIPPRENLYSNSYIICVSSIYGTCEDDYNRISDNHYLPFTEKLHRES